MVNLIGLQPEETFISEQEYPEYFASLNGLRRKVVEAIPLEARMRVLDVLTGSAYFAIELAKRDPSLRIVGIDVSDRAVKTADKNIRVGWFDSSITILGMDATRLEFPASSFSIATNFLGLEDVHMMMGAKGVREAFHEVARVLKPRGYFCFMIMPPEEAETPAQRLECEVYSYACDKTWLPAIRYQEFLRGAGLTLLKREVFYTGRKLTSEQAKREIASIIDSASKIQGIKIRPLEDVWRKFGAEIESNGLGRYSRTVLMIARKTV